MNGHPQLCLQCGVRARTIAAVLLSLALLCACRGGRNAIVVLDEEWVVEHAKADCDSRARLGIPLCAGDPTLMIRSLEAEIARAFQSEQACKGMTLVTLNVSNRPSQLESRRTFWLFLELMRSNIPDDELRYTVSPAHEPHKSRSEEGQGTPGSIVGPLCDFVRQGGGPVE